MCHLDQKSDGDVAKNGLLKFRGIFNPSRAAAPIAISEYPEKSQYIWTPKASAPNIIENDSIPMGFENILLTKGPMLSAKNNFLKKPKLIKVIPNFKFWFFITNNFNFWEVSDSLNFSLSWGRKLLARRIGPAIKGGKNATKNAYSFKVFEGFNSPL